MLHTFWYSIHTLETAELSHHVVKLLFFNNMFNTVSILDTV